MLAQARRELLFDVIVFLPVDVFQRHVIPQQLARKPNVLRSLLLITRQHPNLDPRLCQCCYRVGNSHLQFVLDCGCTDDNHILLNLLSRPLQRTLPVLERRRGRLVHRVPRLPLLLGQLLLPEHQSPQALCSVLSKLLQHRVHNLLPRSEPLAHDVVCPLDVEHNLALGGADDRRHSLAGRVELVDVEHLVRLLLAEGLDRRVCAALAAEEPPHALGKQRQRALIGALRLVLNLEWVGEVSLRNHRVADRQYPHHIPDRLRVLVALLCPREEPSVVESDRRVPVELCLFRVRLFLCLYRFGVRCSNVSPPLGGSLADLGRAEAVGCTRDEAFAELHDVLGQRASLV
mmetsp:Transcript_42903/g.99702  ORF Transcript_42903/g.99702 Transcript_42903/m.99702 type:complete len:346 (-) Transcript_42903:1302-2339(-)